MAVIQIRDDEMRQQSSAVARDCSPESCAELLIIQAVPGYAIALLCWHISSSRICIVSAARSLIVSAARSLTCRDDLDSKWRLLLAEKELSCVSLLSSISIGN